MKPSALLSIALCFFLIAQMSSDWLLSIETMRAANTCTLSVMSFWASLLLSSTGYSASWTFCSFSWIICRTWSLLPRHTLRVSWSSLLHSRQMHSLSVLQNIAVLAHPVVQFDLGVEQSVSLQSLRLCGEAPGEFHSTTEADPSMLLSRISLKRSGTSQIVALVFNSGLLADVSLQSVDTGSGFCCPSVP